MLAVERVRHSFGERLRAQIVRQHRRPRDRLQHSPMKAVGGDQRNHHQIFAETDKHSGNTPFLASVCQVLFSARKINRRVGRIRPRQILAGRGHGEFAVLDALGPDQRIGNLADFPRLAAHRETSRQLW